MTTERERSTIPDFVFVCGAVGSGNSFLFSSLTMDKNVYGLNEDGLGRTLENLLRPENVSTLCPHGVDRYVEFMHRLRSDRRTLILKTPANIRWATSIRKYLPNSRFVVMIREPHAAVVSGISRHGELYDIEAIARIWLSDYGHLPETGDDRVVITFEELVADPAAVLNRIADFMPLGPEVFAYATSVNRPERSASDRWRTKVDESVAREIERWVAELGLTEIYESAQDGVGLSRSVARATRRAVVGRSGIFAPLVLAKKQLFRIWYRLRR